MRHARAAIQLGMDSTPSAGVPIVTVHPAAEEFRKPANAPAREERKDYFIERDGLKYAGTHLIIDLWGAERLDDIEHIEKALRDSVTAAGATLLHIHLHHFTPNAGVSGVAVLAESHISVHTWPERGFAAFDVFMCGAAKPHKAIEVLEAAFRPGRVVVGEHLRGRAE